MSSTQLKEGVNRRDFLLLGSGAMVAVAAFGSDLLPRAGTPGTTLSIGFAEPDIAARIGADQRFSPNLVPANRIGSSDGAFIGNGARIQAFGPAVDNRKVVKGSQATFDLITYFAPAGAQKEKLPFYTWSTSPDGRRSGPASFTVQVDDQQRLEMGVLVKQQPVKGDRRLPNRRDLLTQADDAPLENNVSLTLLSDPSAPKLRRGYYILAVGGDKFSPNWGSMELRRTENGFQLLEISAFETKPVDFDFVVLSIDYDRNGVQAKKNAAKR